MRTAIKNEIGSVIGRKERHMKNASLANIPAATP
jgi:hypothetical protein